MDDDQKKCGGISAIGIMTILVSLACIGVGGYNVSSSDFSQQNVVSTCRVETRIPFYLVVAGIINIVLIILRLIFQKCCRKCGEPGEDSKMCNSLNFLCKFSCITLYDLLALAIIIIWLVVGSVWTFNAYDKVNYNSGPNYCPAYLYRFTFWTAVLGWIFVTIAFVFGLLAKFCTCFWSILCCRPCKQAEANQV